MSVEVPSTADYAMEPYTPPPTFTEQAVKVWRGITSSAGRAALAALAAAALVVGVIALLPVTTFTQDSTSGLKARCGISYYVGGHSNVAVEAACRHAYNSRAVLVFLSLAVLVLAVGGLCWSFLREARGHESGLPDGLWRLVKEPAGAALLTMSVVLAVVVVLSLRTVPVYLPDAAGDGYRTAHCGIRYFVFGAGSTDVQTACRDRYAGHAWIFFAALVALAVCLYLMVKMTRSASSSSSFGGAAVERAAPRQAEPRIEAELEAAPSGAGAARAAVGQAPSPSVRRRRPLSATPEG